MCHDKLYKLTNETEIHNGFKYQDGLNIDTETFNPFGECSKGRLLIKFLNLPV